jgi:PelA/Pel-15E family pectate lyase
MKCFSLTSLMLSVVPPLFAGIIGTNPGALPLTANRIAALPKDRQPTWQNYLAHAERQLRADQNFFRAEMKKHGVKESLSPPPGSSRSRLPLNQPAVWYRQAEVLRIADIVVSFQTPAGGWSKNLDMTQHPRAPGEQFAAGNTSIYLAKFDNDVPRDLHWNFVGTFDNGATTTQLRYLAKVVAAAGPDRGDSYRAAFLRGVDYILAAQFPNGGWPQVWPLQGGYHDAITYNDDAMIKVLQLLSDVASGQNEFAFVPERTRKLAAADVRRGVECILETQITVDGRRTVWCQQHDALTLQPTSARNYEMPSQSGSESAEVMIFLMRLPNPNPRTVAAVHAAAAWFEKTKLRDVAFKAIGDDGRQLVPSRGNGPLWARYYEMGSDRPIFGDRDKTIHDTVSEISKERRDGYSWFNEAPKQALEQNARWSAAHSSTL